ncbi:MAG: ssDNA-binding domain-containing protein [Clostridiales Family XIII bacterium]|jgi:hypothetical protein|nr:ssDNA-binding domain-containing protein [Clostridiales Family XIII bacterium]
MEDYSTILGKEEQDSVEEPNDAQWLSKEEFAASKRAARDEVFSLSDETAMKVAGSSSEFQQFLNLQAHFDQYSTVNALLILAQDKNASRLGSFNYWKRKNCSVKSGQRAISILEPHEYVKSDGTPGIGYNLRKVFDISQVDAHRLSPPIPPHRTDRQLLQALISKMPARIRLMDELPDNLAATTDPETREILVRKGMGFPEIFQGVAQELCYAETIRNNGNPPTDPRFTAYCGAYLLCVQYGVEAKNFDFTIAPDFLREMSAQEIKSELSRVRDVAEIVSGRMAKSLDAQEKPEKDQESR